MSLWERFKDFAAQCYRVLRITKKPTKEEYSAVVKAAGLGILIIGFIGFALHLVKVLVWP